MSMFKLCFTFMSLICPLWIEGDSSIQDIQSENFRIDIQWPVPGSVHPGGVAHFNYTVSECPPNSYIIFHLDNTRVGGEYGVFMCNPFMWHGMTSIEPGIRKAYFTLELANRVEPLAHASTYVEIIPSPGRLLLPPRPTGRLGSFPSTDRPLHR